MSINRKFRKFARLQRYGWLVAVGGVLLMAASSVMPPPSIAVIDPDRIRRESVSISGQMEKMAAPAREILGELQLKQAALSKALEEFNKKRSALSEETLRKQAAALQKQSQEVQDLSRQLKERMDKAESQGIAPMRQRVGTVVGEVARARGIKLVLAASSVLYNTEDLDLTGDVIARLDAGGKKR